MGASPLKVDRISLRPAASACAAESITARTVHKLPLDLPPGSVFTSHLPGASRVFLQLSGDEGASAEVYLSPGSEPRRLESLLDAHQSAVIDLELRQEEHLTLLARGPGVLRLEDARIELTLARLRRECGLRAREVLVGLVFAAVLLAVFLVRRLPGEATALWSDPLLLFALALALRGCFVWFYPSEALFTDSHEYIFRAQLLANGASFLGDIEWHRWQTWLRPPGYYAFLAAMLRSGNWTALVQVQALLSAVGVAASYHIAYPLFGRRTAIAAGLLLTVNVQSVASASWVLSEPLLAPVLTAGLACLAWLSRRPNRRLAAVTGGIFGCAALVRSAPIPFVWLAAATLAASRGRRWLAPAATMVIGMLVVTLTWSLRNGLVLHDRPVFENTAIANFLLRHPDDSVLPHADLDLATKEGFDAYLGAHHEEQ